MSNVILIGGGEHARVVLDCLLAQKTEVSGLFDPKYSGELFGVKQLGEYDPEFKKASKAIVAIGNNAVRKKVVQKTVHAFTNAIHPSSIVSAHTTIGVGNMILHGVILQAQSTLGNHVILNTGAKVDHDCKIEDFVHVAPGAILCGCVQVGEGSLIGAGAVILPGIKVGAWSTVAAGAVVTKNVAEGTTVVGNPARILKAGTK